METLFEQMLTEDGRAANFSPGGDSAFPAALCFLSGICLFCEPRGWQASLFLFIVLVHSFLLHTKRISHTYTQSPSSSTERRAELPICAIGPRQLSVLYILSAVHACQPQSLAGTSYTSENRYSCTGKVFLKSSRVFFKSNNAGELTSQMC